MIKCIIFDLGNVCFKSKKEDFFRKAMKKYNFTRKQLMGCFKSKSRKMYYLYSTGKIDGYEFKKRVIKYLNISEENFYDLIQMWLDAYTVMKGMPALIKKLSKNYSLYIYSGNSPVRVKYAMTFSFLKYFSKKLFSYDFKKTKCESTNKGAKDLIKFIKPFKPEECVEIDDRNYIIKPLKKFGFPTITFESAKQLEKELKKLGVKI